MELLGKTSKEQTVPPTREFDFDWEGQKIHVYQWGKAENIPVVLLHGFMQTGLSWSIIAAALSGNHCAYALDFLGHGRSSKPSNVELYRYDAMCVWWNRSWNRLRVWGMKAPSAAPTL